MSNVNVKVMKEAGSLGSPGAMLTTKSKRMLPPGGHAGDFAMLNMLPPGEDISDQHISEVSKATGMSTKSSEAIVRDAD